MPQRVSSHLHLCSFVVDGEVAGLAGLCYFCMNMSTYVRARQYMIRTSTYVLVVYARACSFVLVFGICIFTFVCMYFAYQATRKYMITYFFSIPAII